MRRLAILPALAAVLFLAACSGATTSPTSPPPASAGGGSSPAAASAGGGSSPAAASPGAGGGAACAVAPSGSAATVNATIKDFKFAPQPIEAKVGDVIAWANQDSTAHTVTLDDGTCDTKSIAAGATAMLVFSAPGTYAYHCAIHPAMKGFTIDVK